MVSLPRGNQPKHLAAEGIGDREKSPFNLAESDPPLLAIIPARVRRVTPGGVEKDAGGVLKRYAMLSDGSEAVRGRSNGG